MNRGTEDHGVAHGSGWRSLWMIAALIAGAWGHPDPLRSQDQLSFAFLLTDPRGELGRNIDSFDGPYLSYLRDLGASRRWALGATGMGGAYGSVGRPVSLPGYRAEAQNSIGFAVGVLQFRPLRGSVQPYVQGAGGVGWFSTSTLLSCDDCGTFGGGYHTDHSDATFVWGGSGGLLVRVYQRPPRPAVGDEASVTASDDEPLAVYLDLATRYLRGGKAEYVPGDPIFTDQGTIEEDQLMKSRLQALQVQIGVSVRF